MTTIDVFNPTLKFGIQQLSTTAETIAEVTVEPTGFEDPDNVGHSYSRTNRQVTLTHPSGTIAWWYKGVRYTTTSPWVSPAHTATVGNWFLTIDGDESAAAWSTVPWVFYDVIAAFVRYGATAVDTFCLRESHGLMQWQSHQELHATIGTYWVSGLTLDPATYAINGTTDAQNSWGALTGVIKDEDLATTIPALAEGSYTMGYRSGANGDWVFSQGNTLPFFVAANTLQRNIFSGGTWALSAMSEDNFINYYHFAFPVASDADSVKWAHVVLPGQVQYTTLAAAQAEFPQNLELGDFAILSPEFVCVNRITLQYNASGAGNKSTTGRCAIQGVTPIRGSRANQVAVAGAAPSIHNNLSGRADAACHPLEAIGDDVAKAGRVVFVDAAGALGTDTGLTYDAATDTLGASNIQATTSAGLTIKSDSGATVVQFGPGGGQAAAFGDGASFTGTVSVDTIAEKTAAAGVTVDGLLIKDGAITSAGVSDFAEAAQDAVGAMLFDTNTVDLSYIDGTPGLSAAVKYQSTPNILVSDDSSGLKVDTRGYKNYITNPDTEIDTTGITAGANTTLTRITSGQLFGSGSLQITSSGAWSVTWSVDTLDAGMQNRLGEFQIIAKGAVIAGASLQVKSGSTVVGDYSAGLAQISATDAKPFGGTFPVGTLPATYTVVLSGSGTITAGNLITDLVYLGSPKSVTSGQITTPWTSFTPTGAWTTNTTYTGQYRRVGDSAEFRVRVALSGAPDATNLTINIPFTIDTAKLTSPQASVVRFGYGSARDTGTTSYPVNVVYSSATAVSVRAVNADSTYAINANSVSNTVPFTFGNTDDIDVTFTVPISGWQATDIVTPEASLEEFASDTGSADVFGPTGSLVPTGSTTRTFVYPGTIANTDDFALEMTANDGVDWHSLPLVESGGSEIACSLLQEGANTYGAAIRTSASANTVQVFFGTYAFNNSGTYGGAGLSWNTLNGAGWRWRVRRTKTVGQQSFFLQAPVKGGNSGNAIPAGFIGEILSNDGSSTVLTTAQYSDGGCSPVVLTPGAWDVQASAYFDPASGSTVTASVLVGIGTATGNSGTGVTNDAITRVPGVAAGGAQNMGTPLKRYYVAPGATLTLYPKILGVFTVAGLNGIAYIRARRVD